MKRIFLNRKLQFAVIILICFSMIDCPQKPSPKILGGLLLVTTPASLISISKSQVSVTEGLNNDTYTIVLTKLPTSDVTVDISFNTSHLRVNNLTTSPIQLTFTTANWNTAQTITVEALYDNIAEGTHTQTISHTSASTDSNFNGINISSVNVGITDTVGATVNGNFQSGQITLASSSQSIPLTTTVDPTKAFVTCNAKLTSSNTDRAITCQLNSAGTQVEIQSGGGLGAVVDWYVMEYATGVTVQRNASSLTAGLSLIDVTLGTAIITSKTFVILYTRSSVGGNNADGNRTVKGTLTSTTNLRLERSQTTSSATVEWQVVQFDEANVRSGTVSISNGNTNTTSAIGASINLNSSFLVFNYSSASAIAGVERDYYVRGTFSNSSTVSFTRRGTNQNIDISWFAVEMLDGTTVQRGSSSITGIGGGTSGNTGVNATLSSSVTPAKSMILFSNDTETGDSGVATQDSGTYTATFNSATEINLSRYNDESNAASIDWFVISFE